MSIDAAPRFGVTTGISAQDRATTIRVAVDPATVPSDLRHGGHVFPLRARDGGVLQRVGHTEAAVDLARLAGRLSRRRDLRDPERGRHDGAAAAAREVRAGARHHLHHRRAARRAPAQERAPRASRRRGAAADRASARGGSSATGTTSTTHEHVALVYGEVGDGENVLVRMHSKCLTGDVFHSLRCDCGWQLDTAMEMIAARRAAA